MSYEINGPIERVKSTPRELAKVLPGLFAGENGAVVIVPKKRGEAGTLIPYHLALIRYTVMRSGYVVETPKGYYESRGINVDMHTNRRPPINPENIYLRATTVLSEDVATVSETGEKLYPLETALTQATSLDPKTNLELLMLAEAGITIADFVLRGSGVYGPVSAPATIDKHGEQLLEGAVATI